MYRIRSTDNVYYIENYYKLLNRPSPQIYYNETRISLKSTDWINNKLWKTKQPDNDPSDTTHPFHGIFLAIVESSKQAIASIEIQLNDHKKPLTIQHL